MYIHSGVRLSCDHNQFCLFVWLPDFVPGESGVGSQVRSIDMCECHLDAD